MGFCINCEECKRLYDTKYFTEFCPYCYASDELFKEKAELVAERDKLKNEHDLMFGALLVHDPKLLITLKIGDEESIIEGK